MNTKEWALIIFTILAQVSVGSFIVLSISHAYATRKYGSEQADIFGDRALMAIWVMLGMALVASFFHLSNPLNAPRAITNISSSWLSREILSSVLFFGLGVILTFLQWRKLGSYRLRNALAVVIGLVGLFLVYAMGRIYQIAAQPAWNTFATPVMFFAATFLLGSLAVGAALAANYTRVKNKKPDCAEIQCALLRSTVRAIAMASLVLLGVEVVTIATRAIYLAGSGVSEATASAAVYATQFSGLFVLRLVLVFLGAGVFALFLYRNALNAGHEKTIGALIFGAFALVLSAEIIGRFMFYAAHIKIGI